MQRYETGNKHLFSTYYVPNTILNASIVQAKSWVSELYITLKLAKPIRLGKSSGKILAVSHRKKSDRQAGEIRDPQ